MNDREFMKYILNGLSANAILFSETFTHVRPEFIRWKPAPDKWCLLEILCHLRDEEREDFRARFKHILEKPEQQFVSIDPQAWVSERAYLDTDYETALTEFLEERTRSIEYLALLKEPLLHNIHMHPRAGAISAKMILANWVAHDLLHMRQITKLKYDLLTACSAEDLGYAGTW